MADDFSRMAVLKLIPPRRKRDYLQLAKISFSLLLLGVLLDEFSTWLVLESGGYEMNPYVADLIQKGLWLPYDLAIIMLSVVIVHYCYRRWRRWEQLVFPALYGSMRFLAACHNFLTFF